MEAILKPTKTDSKKKGRYFGRLLLKSSEFCVYMHVLITFVDGSISNKR